MLPGWTVETMTRDELDLMPDGKPMPPNVEAKSREELLARFDAAVGKARAALAAGTDASMMQTWTLLSAGQKMMAMPPV